MIMFKFILFTLLISTYHCRIPDKVYCVNQQCSEPISKAKTLLSYTSADPDLISFRGNADALIFMKSAGSNHDLWYANIDGRIGFVNSKFLREYKVIQKTSELGVYPLETRKSPEVQPDKVQQAHEVIEGTTIFTTESTVNTPAESFTEPPASSVIENVTPALTESIPTPQVSETVEKVINEVADLNNDVINSHLDLPTSHETNSVELITDAPIESNTQTLTENQVPESGETENEAQPPQVPNEVPEVPVPQPLAIVSGVDPSGSVPIDMPEKSNNLQDDLVKSDSANSIEQNTSHPADNAADIQPPAEIVTETNNVPVTNENLNVATTDTPIVNEVEKDNGLFGNFFSLDNNDNINGASSTPAPVADPETPTTEANNINIAEIPSTPSTLQEIPPTHAVIPPSFPDNNNIYTYPPVPVPPSEIIEPHHLHQTIEPNNNFYQDPSSQGITPESNQYTYSSPPPPMEELNTNHPDSYTTSQPDVSAETQYPEPADVLDKLPVESTEQAEETTESPPDYSTMSTEDLIDDIFTASTETPAPAEENEEGILSNIYTTIADLWPSTTEAPLTESIYNPEYSAANEKKVDEGYSFVNFVLSGFKVPSQESHAIFASGGEACYSEDYCDGTSNNHGNRLLTFLITTATSVLLFTLGYYYIDNKRQDGKLIGTINTLQRDLLFTSKECEILKEELASTKSKLAGIEDSSFGKDDMVQSLKEEIDELKAQNERLRRSLDDNEKLLRVSENTAGELQNTLGEVENTLSELLGERATSEEQIAELNGKIQAFEEELISVTRDRDNYQLKYVSAETALEEAKKQNSKLDELTQKLSEANNTIELQKHEIAALKDALKDLKNGLSPNVDITSLIDHTEIKAKLSKALEEKQSFEKKFEVEYKERKRLNEELQVTQESLVTTTQQATEALTRLEVLGKYFQERESELMKELSTKESLWLSKQGESASTVEKIELLQQEVQRYKEKCDALALELAEQESMRRTAVGEVEARAHSAWLEARAARREADAARDEAATLRRKLASVAAPGAASPHHKVASPLDVTDNSIPPLPPMAFLPPPLLPPLPRAPPPLLPPLPRPPPLGRLPSPHPPRYGDRRYSPDSRYSPESRYSAGSRYSPEPARHSPDRRYSPRVRRSPYSPRTRRRSRSRERYDDGRNARSRTGPADTETEYNSDSPSREPRRRRRYSRSGPSSGSGCSSESDK